ncbi:MAG: YqgE/AlgH family protein [Saprospiraceae bacterium]
MARRGKYTGKILLSEPFMLDPNFKRSAVIVVDYTKADGTVGFIINKPIDMRIDDLVADFPEFEAEVYFGGPVQTDTIHYLHNLGDLLEGSTKISEGVYWGGDFEKLKFLIQQELVKPAQIKFFVGYSGWSGGQLETEMETGSWVIADLDANYIFKEDPMGLWQQILEHKGDTYGVIGQMPDSANWN